MDNGPVDPGDCRNESPERAVRPDGGADEPDTGDRHCVNCGEPLNRYSKFCSECGTEQPSIDDDPEQSGPERQQDRRGRGGGQDSRWQQDRSGGGGGQSDGWQQDGSRGGGRQDSGPQQGRSGRQQRRGGRQQGHSGHPNRRRTTGPGSNTRVAAVAHLSALVAGLFGVGLLGPILVYAFVDDPFLKQNAANATNWQIILLVYLFVSFICTFLLFFLFPPLAFLSILLFFALLLANLVFIIIATVRALNGEAWEYPLTPELL